MENFIVYTLRTTLCPLGFSVSGLYLLLTKFLGVFTTPSPSPRRPLRPPPHRSVCGFWYARIIRERQRSNRAILIWFLNDNFEGPPQKRQRRMIASYLTRLIRRTLFGPRRQLYTDNIINTYYYSLWMPVVWVAYNQPV